MSKVEIDVSVLRTIVDNFYEGYSPGGVIRQIKNTKEVLGAYKKLEAAIADISRPGAVIEVGHVVIPKDGCNYLRTGNSARSIAVVMALDPFSIMSVDGKHLWTNLAMDLFIVDRKISDTEFALLKESYEQIKTSGWY